MALRILTVGHSTREPEAFLDLLARHGVARLVDIRTVPRSRRMPWTSVDELPRVLAARGIRHAHLAGLGGLRRPRRDSPNDGWRNEGFRGYADHMGSPEFGAALAQLLEMAEQAQVVVMCAEAVPWRCHRSLLADALLVRGVEVEHIMDAGAKPHAITAFAKVDGTRITYPAAPGVQSRLASAEEGGADSDEGDSEETKERRARR